MKTWGYLVVSFHDGDCELVSVARSGHTATEQQPRLTENKILRNFFFDEIKHKTSFGTVLGSRQLVFWKQVE